ncbi:MAG: ribose-5-phosphate isomerase RpiA [Candidatus Marsarchaeota archaeon]
MDEAVVEQRRRAAREASALIEDGMLVGLGSGSTLELFVKEFLKGKRVELIAASRATQLLVHSLGLRCYYLESPGSPEVTFDGADRADPVLNLVKGGGAALLGEKLLAKRSKKYVVMIDAKKFVPRLFGDFPLPVEIEPISFPYVIATLGDMGLKWKLRAGTGKNGPVVTDNGNWIVDVDLSGYQGDPLSIARELKSLTGVVETGLFEGLVDELVIGHDEGVTVIRSAK